MEISVFVEVERPIEAVWQAITNFRNCSDYINSIAKIEIINEPEDTLIGFKWKETRVMFGKEAVETMWITDYIDNEYYQTRAESHGSVYKSRLSVERAGNKTKLTMTFTAEAQTFISRVLSKCMGPFIKGSMKKALIKDLNDIKTYLEAR